MAIKICECGEPLVDIRTLGGVLYGPPPECPQTEPDYCFVRREVYRKLVRVQQALPPGYNLRLYEGFRSLEVQGLLFAQEKARVQKRQPNLTAEEVHAETSRLVSPVVHFDGSPNVPPHSTGGAVDVDFVDGQGKTIDFGMELKDWTTVPPEVCAPNYTILTPIAAKNRLFLARAMEREGFVPYQHEWWHFSYGDRNWAVATGKSNALYGYFLRP